MSQDRLILFKNVYKEYEGIEVLTNINLYIKKNDKKRRIGACGESRKQKFQQKLRKFLGRKPLRPVIE